MRNRIAVVLCALVLITGVPLALSAQITSPTATVSSGMFFTDADYAFGSFDVIQFSKLEAKSIFTADFSSSSYLNLGYGAKLGGVFIAGSYSGNILNDTVYANNSYYTTNLLAGDSSIVGTRQSSGTNPYSTPFSNNTINLLLGFGAIGIQASVAEYNNLATKNYNYAPSLNLGTTSWGLSPTSDSSVSYSSTSYDTSGAVKTTQTVTPSVSGENYWSPTLTLGAVLNLGNVIVSPVLFVNAKLDSDSFAAKYVNYKSIDSSGLATYQSIANVSSYTSSDYAAKFSYTGLTGGIGSKIEAGAWTFDLSYTFSTDLYSNSYTDTDGTTSKTGNGYVSSYAYTYYTANLAGTSTATTHGYEVDPQTYYDHIIKANFQYTIPVANKLKVALSFQPKVELNNTSSSASGSQVTTTVAANYATPTSGSTTVETKTYTGQSSTSSTMKFTPIFASAVTCPIIDKVLDLNVGAGVVLANLSTITNTYTMPGYSSDKIVQTNNDGTIASTSYTTTLGSGRSESSDTTFTFNGVYVYYGFDLSWKLLDNVVLDTALSYGSFSVQLTIKK
jgi:hypothetical protein